MQSVWVKDEWGDAWEATFVDIVDSSVTLTYIHTEWSGADDNGEHRLPLAEVFLNECCTEPMRSDGPLSLSVDDKQSKNENETGVDDFDFVGKASEWVMPFAQAFDDETQAFPYGTYGDMAAMVRTPLGAVRRLLEMLEAGEKEGEDTFSRTFIDVGCGDGAVLNAVAKYHANWKCVGVDIALKTLEDASVASIEEGTASRMWFSQCDYRELLPLHSHSLFTCTGYDSSNMAAFPQMFLSTVPAPTCLQYLHPQQSASQPFGSVILYLYLVPCMVRNKDFRENVILPMLEGGAAVVAWCYLPGDDGNGIEWPYLWKEDRKLKLKIYYRVPGTELHSIATLGD